MKKTGRGIITLAILAALTTNGRATGVVTTNPSGSESHAMVSLAATSNVGAPLGATDGLPLNEIKPKFSLRVVVDGMVQREIWT
ncbi:MAG: hypothetical protein NTW03_02655, partial [Verrucomicrobia bacterium]|nr:hypothetical protein [Verrucomicrobiota bacterium]